MSLMILATQPLTWLIAYAGAKGSVRLAGAAFTENNLGAPPLFVFDQLYLKITWRGGPSAAAATGYTETNLSKR